MLELAYMKGMSIRMLVEACSRDDLLFLISFHIALNLYDFPI